MSSASFQRLVELVATLRGENGCPWDREQTHESLQDDLLEEAYEAIEAIEVADAQKLKEELGDLFLVLLLHIQIAIDEERFDLEGVLSSIIEKIIRRHPHVFGDTEVRNAQEVLQNWERIKRGEASHAERTSLMDGIPKPLPALMAAQKIQKKAARVGFDWKHLHEVLPKLAEELDELRIAIDEQDDEAVEMEFGDLLFSMVNVARFLQLNAEEALRHANAKFIERFKRMEQKLAERGTQFTDYDLEGLDEIWEEAKSELARDRETL